MSQFTYLRPDTLAGAIEALAAYGAEARLLAGGTDLLVRLRLGHWRPRVVVDLKRAAGLTADIRDIDGAIRVGARAVMTDLIEDARIQRHFPALVEAARVVGSIQIRNRATLAGNICNASPAADTAPALLVYGAIVNLAGPAGTRRVPLTEFITGPGRTVLTKGELVESIDLPLPAEPSGAAFGRVTRRKGVDLATINLVGLVTASGTARFAYGAVGPRPFLVTDDSGTLGPSSRDAASRDAAFERLIAHASPITDVRGGADYRKAMLLVMSRRTWKTAVDRLAGAQQRRRPS
jgi:carbon-monoxide dehydrogenase medium subunit